MFQAEEPPKAASASATNSIHSKTAAVNSTPTLRNLYTHLTI
jgi:hypothetical protein